MESCSCVRNCSRLSETILMDIGNGLMSGSWQIGKDMAASTQQDILDIRPGVKVRSLAVGRRFNGISKDKHHRPFCSMTILNMQAIRRRSERARKKMRRIGLTMRASFDLSDTGPHRAVTSQACQPTTILHLRRHFSLSGLLLLLLGRKLDHTGERESPDDGSRTTQPWSLIQQQDEEKRNGWKCTSGVRRNLDRIVGSRSVVTRL